VGLSALPSHYCYCVCDRKLSDTNLVKSPLTSCSYRSRRASVEAHDTRLTSSPFLVLICSGGILVAIQSYDCFQLELVKLIFPRVQGAATSALPSGSKFR